MGRVMQASQAISALSRINACSKPPRVMIVFEDVNDRFRFEMSVKQEFQKDQHTADAASFECCGLKWEIR